MQLISRGRGGESVARLWLTPNSLPPLFVEQLRRVLGDAEGRDYLRGVGPLRAEPRRGRGERRRCQRGGGTRARQLTFVLRAPGRQRAFAEEERVEQPRESDEEDRDRDEQRPRRVGGDAESEEDGREDRAQEDYLRAPADASPLFVAPFVLRRGLRGRRYALRGEERGDARQRQAAARAETRLVVKLLLRAARAEHSWLHLKIASAFHRAEYAAAGG